MIATTIAALGYKLFTDYLPRKNFMLATTDMVLLALSLGVLVMSIRQFMPASGKPQTTVAS
ncbi:MAG: hypothetical protein NTW07_12780 [candidate division Zixibacteria bacterium]|nr:hypothetical protein [candidate division Zixibacteria bacterium]